MGKCLMNLERLYSEAPPSAPKCTKQFIESKNSNSESFSLARDDVKNLLL